MACGEGCGMSAPNSSARVESSDASAKKEIWLREGKALIRLAKSADSTQHDRRLIEREGGSPGKEWSSSSGSNIDKSIMIDLVVSP